MSNLEKRIEILKGSELKKTISRLTFEIIEKVNNLENLLFLGIPTRGVFLSEVLTREMKNETGTKIIQGVIDPTLHRDDQNKIGTRLIRATDIPSSIENKEIILIDDVLFTGRTIRAAMEAIHSWGRPKKIMLLVMIDRGHRELPIQPDFCGKKVPTSRNESIELRINSIDGEEGVFLNKK
tara:strand:- start:769 stop:1311 length:543 start_codon:yes stop_codon:yes gene_type:complete